MTPDPPKEKAVHDLTTALRAEGYTVGLGVKDYVEDFPEHVEASRDLLNADDLGACFVVAHREGQTDYSSSVAVDNSVAWSVIQIQMLGAHFRAVHEALPLDVSEIVDAMVDEALAIDENPDFEPPGDDHAD